MSGMAERHVTKSDLRGAIVFWDSELWPRTTKNFQAFRDLSPRRSPAKFEPWRAWRAAKREERLGPRPSKPPFRVNTFSASRATV